MASWKDVGEAAPELARGVETAFDAHLHKTVATLRRSTRISGVEATFGDGELWLGMMPGSIKARDLLHDPRLAIHSATADSEMKNGDAKIAGRAVEITDREISGDLPTLRAMTPERENPTYFGETSQKPC